MVIAVKAFKLTSAVICFKITWDEGELFMPTHPCLCFGCKQGCDVT